ncbi:MAG TPA: hypothetical protein VF545_11305 [Thermoleophilaceae bacterium]|jgi:hypothetical protein
MSTLTPGRIRRRQGAGDSNGGSPADSKPAPKPADPRLKALWRFATSITVFTVLGGLFLGFEDSYLQPLVALATAYSLEIGLEALEARSCDRPACYAGGGVRGFIEGMLPAHITGLSVALLLYTGDRIGPIIFAVTVAQCSKFILTARVKGRKRHFMNPSNFGIAITLLALPSVAMVPAYQFTENSSHNVIAWLLPAFVILAGTMINAKLTKKMPLIFGWLGGFLLQAILRSAIFGTPLAAPLLPLTGLVFWLYTNYMITDPGTTPMKPRNQVIFGFSVAALYGVLVALHVGFALFFALVIVCAARGLVLWAPVWLAALRRLGQPSGAGVGEAAREMAS